jgi:predicted RNA binding protein YcfA (HicA-like mRNA interferase family)
MPKLPRWTATEAERARLHAGFDHLRSKGSHRIYGKAELRVTVPFHGSETLHPKIVKQVLEMIEAAG